MATHVKYLGSQDCKIVTLESGSIDYIQFNIFSNLGTEGYAVTSEGYVPEDTGNTPPIITKNSTTKWTFDSADLTYLFVRNIYNGYGWNTTSDATFLADLKTFVENNSPETWGADKLILFYHFTFSDPIEGELDCYCNFVYQGNIGDATL